MSKLMDREERRKAVGQMVSQGGAASGGVAHRGRPKEDRELKKRVSLSLRPSSYEAIQKIAYVQRRSVSDLMDAMMEQFIKEHEDDLMEYEKLQDR